MCVEGQIHALVLQTAAVAPVLLDTAQEGELAQGEQVVCPGLEVVEGDREAVVEHLGLKAEVEAAGGLPLQLGVTDVLEHVRRHLGQEEVAGEIGA